MPRRIKAATWNMGGGEAHGGPTDQQVATTLAAAAKTGATILLGQEASDRNDRAALRDLGFTIFRAGPECLVAWKNDTWKPLAKRDVILNPTQPYWRVGGAKVTMHMPEVILGDPQGRTLRVGSYHLPSSVQDPNPPANRMAALREAMETMADRAARSATHGVLYGGDDNVDEAGAYGPWEFMLGRVTGLRQVRAPRNTLGVRKVDDFRISGLKPKGKGRVIHGPTHHNVFVQRFGWK